jgi:hypothetical protein
LIKQAGLEFSNCSANSRQGWQAVYEQFKFKLKTGMSYLDLEICLSTEPTLSVDSIPLRSGNTGI